MSKDNENKNEPDNVVSIFPQEGDEGFAVFRIPIEPQEGMTTELLVMQHAEHPHPNDIVLSFVQVDDEGFTESVAMRAIDLHDVMGPMIEVIQSLVDQYNTKTTGVKNNVH